VLKSRLSRHWHWRWVSAILIPMQTPPKRKLILLLLLVIILVFASTATACPRPSPTLDLNVHFVDVGQGDAIFIDLGSTEVLIDGGEKSAGPGLVNDIAPFIQGPLEAVVATHPHADHIGGLPDVFAAFQVEQVFYNGETSTSQSYADFIAAVQSENATVHVARRGDVIAIGALAMKVLNPSNLTGTTNNNSIVISLTYGSIDFLFTGDAEKEAEAEMLANGILGHAEILKVGHHGSRTASSPAFLAVVKPEAAVYSAGVGNSYGHPHAEIILALQDMGAKIYGTDVNGTIDISTNGKTYIVQPERGQAR
jgi:competence protein ComEC